MRILLDECIDGRFARQLLGHDVSTVAEMKWKGARNGELLKRAQASGFQAFVTVDRNLAFQQHIAKTELAVFVLRAPSNRLRDLVALVPKLQSAVPRAAPGTVTFIPAAEI